MRARASLYQDFSPSFYYWRLVLIGRKVLFLTVATFARDNLMFQTSLALGIIAVAYGLQRWLSPFISAAEQHALVLEAAHNGRADGDAHRRRRAGGATAAAADVAPLPPRRRSSVAAVATAAAATLEHVTEFNVLESVLLVTCFGVLLGGAMFKSAVFEQGDFFHWSLTVMIFCMLLATMGMFGWMTAAEVRRAFAAAAVREAASERRGSRVALLGANFAAKLAYSVGRLSLRRLGSSRVQQPSGEAVVYVANPLRSEGGAACGAGGGDGVHSTGGGRAAAAGASRPAEASLASEASAGTSEVFTEACGGQPRDAPGAPGALCGPGASTASRHGATGRAGGPLAAVIAALGDWRERTLAGAEAWIACHPGAVSRIEGATRVVRRVLDSARGTVLMVVVQRLTVLWERMRASAAADWLSVQRAQCAVRGRATASSVPVMAAHRTCARLAAALRAGSLRVAELSRAVWASVWGTRHGAACALAAARFLHAVRPLGALVRRRLAAGGRVHALTVLVRAAAAAVWWAAAGCCVVFWRALCGGRPVSAAAVTCTPRAPDATA